MIDPTQVTLDTFPSWEDWQAQEPEADKEAWIEWHAALREAASVPSVNLTTAPARTLGYQRRQTIYRVQWQRGTSSAKSRITTKRATALALVEKIKHPEARRGAYARPLEYVRMFTGSVVWDEIEEMS